MTIIYDIYRGSHNGVDNIPLVRYRLDNDKKDRIAKILPKFTDTHGITHELEGETRGDYQRQAEALVEHYAVLSNKAKEHEYVMPIHDKLDRRDKGKEASEHGKQLQTIRKLFNELSSQDKEKLLSEWSNDIDKSNNIEQSMADGTDMAFLNEVTKLQIAADSFRDMVNQLK